VQGNTALLRKEVSTLATQEKEPTISGWRSVLVVAIFLVAGIAGTFGEMYLVYHSMPIRYLTPMVVFTLVGYAVLLLPYHLQTMGWVIVIHAARIVFAGYGLGMFAYYICPLTFWSFTVVAQTGENGYNAVPYE
jgi:hypothetical protein